MKLTIIETGRTPESLRQDWPEYPEMFRSLLAPHIADVETECIALTKGNSLPDPAISSSILITGSAYGVYDDVDWMADLFAFIRAAGKAQTPLIGICFGHQAVAAAYGADVGKSDKGWGIGRHEYEIVHTPPWLTPDPGDQFSLGVSHQDQVKSLPEGATLVARSAFTPYAALDYPAERAMSFQGHPEFSAAFSCALYTLRKGTKIEPEKVEAAEESLAAPIDNALVGRWMANHLLS